MAYSIEVKNKIIERMKKEKIANISKDTGISATTLYRWKKEEKIDGKEEKREIQKPKQEERKKYYEKQKEDFNFRQGYVIFKQKRYKDAKECFFKSINNKGKECNKSIFFIGKIYVIEKRYEEARKEFEKCIEIDRDKNPHARLELGRLYVIEKRYEEAIEEFKKCIEINKNDKFAQDMIEELKKIETIDKILRDREKQAIDSIFLEQTKNSSNNLLSKIRAKIWAGTIENEDIINIEKQKEEIDREQYYLIKIAIYEKLGQKRNALQVIEQIRAEGITIKGITEIRDRLKSKKVAFFDLDKWDQIIGWDVSKTEEYEQELRNVNNTEQNDRLKTQENNIIKTEPPVSSEKVLKPKNRAKERRYVTSEDIAKNNIKPSAKNDEKKQTPKKQKWDNKEITILQTLSYTLKQTIEEINYKYYVEMQPKVTKSILSKEYYDLLQDIGKTNLEEKKRRTKLMQDILKKVYGDGQIREKYVKKYDKLQSILECSSDNKRAKMELILVLINEGYKQVAKIEFGEEYDYIEKIIEQYGKRKMTAKEVKDSIDEYCI